MAEYLAVSPQTVEENENILFLDGDRSCRKGYITHRPGSGIFRLKGVNNCGKTVYRVMFQANIAVAEGGTIPADGIAVALQEDGETLQGSVARVVPAAVGDFTSVSLFAFVHIPCGCCVTFSVTNISDGTAIDVENGDIAFERIA